LKSTLTFNNANESHIVSLRHRSDVTISIETKIITEKMKKELGYPNGKVNFIVIKVPKSSDYNIDSIQMSYQDRLITGYHIVENDDDIEILFFDRFTFTWEMNKLERAGIFRITEKVKVHDESFYFYVNARGFRQYATNIFCLLSQSLVNIYKNNKFRM